MKHCKKCRIDVRNDLHRCPLCYATLEGDSLGTAPSYPVIPNLFVKYNLLLRLAIFLSILTAAICVVVNVVFPPNYPWSLIVLGVIGYCWAILVSAIKKRTNLGFNILIQTLCLSGLMVIIDLITGYREWSFNYVIPFVFIAGTLGVSLLITLTGFRLRDYIIYLLANIMLGFIPVFFLLFGLAHVTWPSITSVGYSIVSLLAAAVFADKQTKTEVKKRLHL